MNKKTYVIGYEYKSAMGASIKNAVICNSEQEYFRVIEKIRKVGYELIYFDGVSTSEAIP